MIGGMTGEMTGVAMVTAINEIKPELSGLYRVQSG